MISLRKAMETDFEELLNSTVTSLRALLTAVGTSAAKGCPPTGKPLEEKLAALQSEISASASPSAMNEAGRKAETELEQWGEATVDYLRQRTNEVKEIMLVVAKAVKTVGERDRRYTKQFSEFTAELEEVAELDDLAAIRRSVVAKASQLRSSVKSMEEDGQKTISQLQAEVNQYQSRLEEVEKLAVRDPLTGLLNRRGVEHQIEQRMNRGGTFSVLMFDLNRFKDVNDKHGHLAGDDLLKQFARELNSLFRNNDIVGRWGGDEFLVVLDCPILDVRDRMASIRQWVFGDYTISGNGTPVKVHLAAEIGIAEWRSGETLDSLIGRADALLLQQKSANGVRR